MGLNNEKCTITECCRLSHCKTLCRYHYNISLNALNPESRKKHDVQYRVSNREKLKERKKAWAKKNHEKVTEYNNKNKERRRLRNQEWRLNNPDKTLKHRTSLTNRYSCLKAKARLRKISCTLSLEEFSSHTLSNCYYCDGFFPKTTQGAGLDRLDNERGYEPGNVIPCCNICNVTRNKNFTVEETKAMIQLVIGMRK